MRLEVRVVPRSSRNALKREEEHLKVYLTAPPVDGAANTALVAFLADYFACPRRDITILRGHNGRLKLIEIANLSPDTFQRKTEKQ